MFRNLLFARYCALLLSILCITTEGFSQVKNLKKHTKSATTRYACNLPPAIKCPSDFLTCPGASTAPSNTGFATGTPGGPNCSAPIISHTDIIVSQGPCTGAIEINRVWTATDPQDPTLTASCLQKIILKDAVAPVIKDCPKDTTVMANSNCNATVFWNAPNVSDNCGKLSLSVNHVSGDIFSIGITQVIYIAEDPCGNTSSCSFNIQVLGSCCDLPPVIQCPAAYKGCPNDNLDPSKTGVPIVSPGSPLCNVPVYKYRDSILSTNGCPGSVKLIRIWTALDPIDSSKQATCMQSIELKDESTPTLLKCPVDITVSPGANCTTKVNWNHPTVVDDCSASTSLVTNIQPNSTFSVGTTAINYTATDPCGNTANCSFTITVSTCCNVNPKITCPAIYISCPGSSIDTSFAGVAIASAGTPNCGQPALSFQDIVAKTGPCIGAQRLFRIWTAKDLIDTNIKSSCVQILDLKDTTGPIFQSLPFDIHIPVDSNCMATAIWQQAVANDACGGTVTLNASHLSGSLFPIGTTIVSYTATDPCGNTSAATFKVVVTGSCCDKPPVIHCPSDYSGCPQTNCNPNISGSATATAGSPSCDTPVISYKDEVIKNYSCLNAKKIKRTWIAKDPNDSTLFASCVQIIDLNDVTPPVFTWCPSDITVDVKGACEKEVWWNTPTVTDNCGIKQITSNYKPGNIFPAGTTTVVVYTAMDNCGNITNRSFKVTVTGTGLKINCPNNIIVDKDPNYNGAIVNWSHPTVTTCSPCTDTIPGFIYMGNYLGNKYFCSTKTATWPNAKIICQNSGGKLCVMNSPDENQFVASKLMGVTAYIGLHDSNSEGYFEWIDGTSVNFTSWATGQPNNSNGDQDYVELLPDGTWNDQYTSSTREFICEVPCYTITQIAGPPCGSLFPCGTTVVTYVVKQGIYKDTCSFTVTVKCNGGNGYCNSKGLDCSPMWIQCVQLANVNNCSGPNGGYKYFNNPCIEVISGNNYNLCLTPGFAGNAYQVYWKVWIDLNGDSDFEDAGELFAYGTGYNKLCGYVTIPNCGGITTRMRVAMSYGCYPPNPCCSFPYGEVEDYCIHIANNIQGGGNSSLTVSENKAQYLVAENSNSIKQTDNSIPDDHELLEQNTNELILYPNPANQKIQFGLIHSNIRKIRIFDNHGKQVFFETLRNPKPLSELDLNEWKPGIFILQLEDENGIIKNARFEKI
jgi:hypothetical protein